MVIYPNNHWDLDLLDFCLDQLDAGLTNDAPLGNGFDLDEAAFEVNVDFVTIIDFECYITTGC